MSRTVTLIGYQDHENLGIGYLASVLYSAGFRPHIVDARAGAGEILNQVRARDPVLIGCSIIFQFFTPAFRSLLRALRNGGVTCHFTAGGHYPSLRWREVLESVPELDSIVLFEGEHTLVELVSTLSSSGDWRSLQGLAWRNGLTPLANALRPLEPDLDRFPPPVRIPGRNYAMGLKEAAILAGRGCLYNCSFCSIREFYSQPPGPLKRVRAPGMVVREMELLHSQIGARIFLFQDDDFPAAAKDGGPWASAFCRLMRESGLDRDVMWKISCRPDEVDAKRFAALRDAGLGVVYLGIESGNQCGLRVLNKHVAVERNVEAVRTLRELGLTCDFGFMLFDPLSTLDTVRENIEFLHRIAGDGYTPVTSCKMIPYAGTAIEESLRESGRLSQFNEHEDYRFLDARVDRLYEWFAGTFERWLTAQNPPGLLRLCRCAKYYLAIHRRLYPPDERTTQLEREVTRATAAANTLFTESMTTAIALHSDSDSFLERGRQLHSLREWTERTGEGFCSRLSEFVRELGRPSPPSGPAGGVNS